MFSILFDRWFGVRFEAPDDKGAGGDGKPAEEKPDPDGKKPDDANGGGKQPDKGKQDDDAALQEKLNKLLPDRAKQYLRSEILGPMGFKSEKELSDALDDLKKRREGEKTDIQKATDRVTELQTAVDQQKAENRRLLVEHQVERAAGELKFHDPQDALVHIQAELKDVEIDEDGKVKGLDELLKKLAKAKPYLIDVAEKPDIDSRTDTKKSKEVDTENLKRRFGL